MTASGCSPATVRYVHAVMRRALGRAVNRGLVPRNVAEGASLPGLGREEAKYLTPEQVKSLLGAAKGDRLEALYVVAVSCGLHQGELLGLRWSEVDLETRRLTVSRQVQRSRIGSCLIFVPTKGKKSRTIRLASTTVEVPECTRVQ
jgi:integrase